MSRADVVIGMAGGLFAQQKSAFTDRQRLKALFCTRRAGKSWAIGVMLFSAALLYPGCSCLYLGLTRASATGTMNKDILRVINRHYRIGAKWSESHSRWTLPNGSYIYLRGADANAYEIDKALGQKYRVAVLDEASKFKQLVGPMVYAKLLPAMGDDLGTIVIAGTPSNITTGLFYDVTTGAEPGWSVHTWTWRDNVFKRDNLLRQHDEILERNPLFATTPLYKQEWLGQWVVDTSALVYRYREDLNVCADLPRPAHEYTYVLGVDLGFSDPTAFVVVAYHEHDPSLYVVFAEKRSGMTFDDVARRIRLLWHQPSMGCMGPYPFAAMVVDAADLQGVETMRQREHLPLEAAEKQGKRGVIEAMNSDLMTARVKVLPAASVILDEWNSLIWDEKARTSLPPKWLEDPRFANHLSDATLYAWRRARNYDATPEPVRPPAPLTPEWEALRLEREIARIERMKREPGGILDDEPPWMRESP